MPVYFCTARKFGSLESVIAEECGANGIFLKGGDGQMDKRAFEAWAVIARVRHVASFPNARHGVTRRLNNTALRQVYADRAVWITE